MGSQLLFIAMVCGACQVLQAMTNGNAAKAGIGVIWVGAMSASVSALSLLLVALFVQQAPFPNWTTLQEHGFKVVLGGMMGAVILTGLTFVAPKLGPTRTFLIYFGVIVAVSLLIDWLGLLGTESKGLSGRQITGIVIAALGLLLARS